MALVGIELETLVSEPDALTTRPPPCAALCKSSKQLNDFVLFSLSSDRLFKN